MTRCEMCGNLFNARKKGKLGTQRFCSIGCQAIWQTKRELGEKNPRWKGGTTRWKNCELCKKPFFCERYIAYIKRRFCSQRCGWKGQQSGRFGESNSNWRGGITPINRAIRSSKEHKEWSRSVLGRDNFTCQSCGKRGGDLHANHLLEFIVYPQYRFIVENGITLCLLCHYLTYRFHGNQFTASIENGVNSENLPDWGQLRAKLLDEICQKKGVTVRNARIAITSTNAPPERDDMT